MDESIVLKPSLIERGAWPLMLIAAGLGLCVEMVSSYSIGDYSVLGMSAKFATVVVTTGMARWYWFKSPTWLFKVDETGIYYQRLINGFDTVIEGVYWDQIASLDQSKMILLDVSGREIMDLSPLRERKDTDTFLKVVTKTIESRRTQLT